MADQKFFLIHIQVCKNADLFAGHGKLTILTSLWTDWGYETLNMSGKLKTSNWIKFWCPHYGGTIFWNSKIKIAAKAKQMKQLTRKSPENFVFFFRSRFIFLRHEAKYFLYFLEGVNLLLGYCIFYNWIWNVLDSQFHTAFGIVTIFVHSNLDLRVTFFYVHFITWIIKNRSKCQKLNFLRSEDIYCKQKRAICSHLLKNVFYADFIFSLHMFFISTSPLATKLFWNRRTHDFSILARTLPATVSSTELVLFTPLPRIWLPCG